MFLILFALISLSEMEEIKMIVESAISCLQLWSANSHPALEVLVPNDLMM